MFDNVPDMFNNVRNMFSNVPNVFSNVLYQTCLVTYCTEHV